MKCENLPRWDAFSDIKAKLSKFIGLCFDSHCLKSPKRAPVGCPLARLLLTPSDWFRSLRPSCMLGREDLEINIWGKKRKKGKKKRN